VLIKQTQLAARVYGVLSEDGIYKLVLDGGRVVPLTDVTEISQSESTATKTETGTTPEAEAETEAEAGNG
jgi:hypothetical protein